MQILWIRTASTCVRYAIVEWDGQTAFQVTPSYFMINPCRGQGGALIS
jgi:hypothetical protein